MAMKMNQKLMEELRLRLKAPFIALNRLAKDRHLPKIFAEAALDELKKAVELLARLEKQKKG